MKKMDNGKVIGPDNIPIEIWKCLRGKDNAWLTKLFNEILRSKRMLTERRKSTLIYIYNNKENIQNYRNYRGIKLMNHAVKLWEKVLENRLRKKYTYIREPIWFYARKINHKGYTSSMKLDEKIPK